RVVSEATRRMQPPKFAIGSTQATSSEAGDSAGAVDPDYHLLNRAAFGPSPWDLEEIRSLGREAWLDRQLRPESIDDTLCTLRAPRLRAPPARPRSLQGVKEAGAARRDHPPHAAPRHLQPPAALRGDGPVLDRPLQHQPREGRLHLLEAL